MSRWIEPVTLEGEHVRLVPLTREHEPALTAAASDGELWKLWYTFVPSPDKTRGYIDTALDMRDRLGAHPFAVIDAKTGDVVGSTRYFNVDEANRRLEIGHTWYARRVQKTALNTEAKLLLLTHAFEKLDAIAVEFRTHFMNHASRTAIARLGAKQDGILRNHQVGRDGVMRDTVVFSIIQSEWPAVRANLNYRLDR
ncbi:MULTISPECIES: GNAT family N-acetyltransferase [Caballeronia]|jgi:RimJ/RimL family protein N-acetyltransferase|uniref:GNAT family protein n=1 Tax=Caballeronia jiangsuensis TaxID=1458357 RepID=A0ABW9CHU8_9BURK|nr:MULTISPECIES: GNAT family protein [Caballeronia]MBC8642639.1 GNAT family N-acetyltransferase [Caballeronia sp. EK]GJH08844.1 GNAT family N-acetyltransferase [Caballeronia novacaledonica]